MKAVVVVATFNQETVIGKTDCEIDGSFYSTTLRHTAGKLGDGGVTLLISWNNMMYPQSSGCVCVHSAPYGQELDNV